MRSGELYIDVILKCTGTEAKNRLNSRQYSVNILNVNAHELMEAIAVTENSEIAVVAFSEKNKGASRQIHREVNRLVHNYVCAVATFADHSRNFMKKYYAETRFYSDYNAEVQRVFHSSEHCRFVRDLRNFMTHRGFPDSNFRMKATRIGDVNDPIDSSGGVPCEITSGVYYKKQRFLEWDKWTAPARRYLLATDEEMELRNMFEGHIEIMHDFNAWFIDRFRIHHAADYEELVELEAEYQRLQEGE
jgi:hypothetical protein